MADPPVTPSAERSDRTGSLLAGRYRFERRIAVGGMAEVWEALDEVLDRPVAIKILHVHLAGDPTFVERFRREAIAAARLTHPSIVAIYDTHSEDGDEAIVMELVRGISLRAHLDDRGALGAEEAVAIGARVAEALETAHRAGLVHRDIKPANILLCEDERVMVADFGIAKLTDADHTTEGMVLGTAKYLAPEQVSAGAVDARTDLYSLGIVLYEMVCGRVPFSGDTDASTVLARLHRDPDPPRQVRSDVPPALEAVILAALARDPAGRPPSAEALRSQLLASVAPGAAVAPPPPAASDEDPTILEAAPPPDGTAVAPVPPPPEPAPGTAKAAPTPAAKATPGSAAPGRPARNWTGPALLIGLVLVALAVAGVLLGRSLGDRFLGSDDPSGSEVDGAGDGPATDLAATASSFDPQGDGDERGDTADRAVDDDPASAWNTETYSTRDFGGLGKDGVGLVLDVDEAASLLGLVVDSPTEGWSAQVYVADGPLEEVPELEDWGPPVAEQTGLTGEVAFDLGGNDGALVLLWITDLGDGEARVEVNDARITAAA